MTGWKCCGCGEVAPDRRPKCDCVTDLMYDPKDTSRVEDKAWHLWTEVGARRWCKDCGSFQVKRNGKWKDAMLGPYPSYNRTDMTMHREWCSQTELPGIDT